MSSPVALSLVLGLAVASPAAAARLPALGAQSLEGDVGCIPWEGPAEGPGGYIYLAASAGGSLGKGSLVRMPLGGGRITEAYAFEGGATGATPASVTEGADGAIYGVSLEGGAGRTGGAFRFDGEVFTVLYDFPSNLATMSGLSAADDGWLYGLISTYASEVWLYRVRADAPAEILGIFHFGDGAPASPPVVGADGEVYYLSHRGDGTVDVMNLIPGVDPEVALNVPVDFEGQYSPGVLRASDGRFTFPCWACEEEGAVYRADPFEGAVESWSFADRLGLFAGGGVVEARSGAIFGVTRSTEIGPNLFYPGSPSWPIGSGVLYRIDPSGAMTSEPLPISPTDFMPSSGSEGRVIIASDGRLYGSQWVGGNPYPGTALGCGGLFWSRTPVR